VLADGDETLLAPHRRRIAVVFCDLRGFTHFSSDAAPEETIEELHDYFQVVGEHLEASEATVGMFAGDGIMAYFGDPVPHPDPAGAAVAMCMALREPMAQLQARWDRRGYDLGYGIGVAYGFATMGTIGFRARSEYTPLGPVVNLASRLCSAARDGEVLVDSRTIDAVADRVEAQERSLSLRGFDLPITAYDVTAWLGAPVLAVSGREHRSVAGIAPLEG
jgi:adenylate cyclase